MNLRFTRKMLIVCSVFLLICVVPVGLQSKKAEAVTSFRPIDLWIEENYKIIQLILDFWSSDILTNIENLLAIESLSELINIVEELKGTIDDVVQVAQSFRIENLLRIPRDLIESRIRSFDLGGYLSKGVGQGLASDIQGTLKELFESNAIPMKIGSVLAERVAEAALMSVQGAQASGRSTASSSWFLSSLFSSTGSSSLHFSSAASSDSEGGGGNSDAEAAWKFVAQAVPFAMPGNYPATLALVAYSEGKDELDAQLAILSTVEASRTNTLAAVAAIDDFHEETRKKYVKSGEAEREKYAKMFEEPSFTSGEQAAARQLAMFVDQNQRAITGLSDLSKRMENKIKMKGIRSLATSAGTTAPMARQLISRQNMMDRVLKLGSEELKKKLFNSSEGGAEQ